MNFVSMDPRKLNDNVFKLIAHDWFLLTAGNLNNGYNTMTASWGGLGHLWNRNVSFVFVRPQRHTWNFMEKNELYTMSFFDETHREALKYCGSHSGRDVDKAAETGLTPWAPDPETVSFREARLVLICRKLYYQDLNPGNMLDDSIPDLYPERGFHRVYTGEIKDTLLKE